MAYSLTIVVKLLPADVGLAATLLAKIYNSSNVLRVTTSAGVGWTELGGGEYQFTYASYDTTDAYVEFFNGATYETSTTVIAPAISDLTGIATSTDVTNAVTSINSHTDINLDAKISTRATPSDITGNNATLVDLVWDEVLTGATHNVPTSAGRRLRQLGTWVAETGTAQNAGSNYITLQASASSTDHFYDQQLVVIIGGTAGVGQARMITEYVGSSRRAYVEPWAVTPTGTIEYEILAASCEMIHMHGTIISATSSTVVLSSDAQPNDFYIGQTIVITGGTGIGQSRYVFDYDNATNTCSVYPNWTITPDNTSMFMFVPSSGAEQVIDKVNSHTDVNLDAKVSTRLPTTSYVAPDNATIGTTGSTVSTNLDAKITSRASATDMATVLSDLTDIKNTLDNLDIDDMTDVIAKLNKVLTRLDSMGSN